MFSIVVHFLNAFIELLIFSYSHHAVVLLRHGNQFRAPDKWFSFQIHFNDEWSCAQKNGVSFRNERIFFCYLSLLICFLVTASLVLGPFYPFLYPDYFLLSFVPFKAASAVYAIFCLLILFHLLLVLAADACQLLKKYFHSRWVKSLLLDALWFFLILSICLIIFCTYWDGVRVMIRLRLRTQFVWYWLLRDVKFFRSFKRVHLKGQCQQIIIFTILIAKFHSTIFEKKCAFNLKPTPFPTYFPNSLFSFHSLFLLFILSFHGLKGWRNFFFLFIHLLFLFLFYFLRRHRKTISSFSDTSQALLPLP